MSGFVVTCGDIFVAPSSVPFPFQAVTSESGVAAMFEQQTSIFPLGAPVQDGDSVHLLRGAAWGPDGVPKDETAARELVISWGRRLWRDRSLVVDGRDHSGVFTLCSVAPDSVVVASDPSGLYPVYLWARPGSAAVSSHERVLARGVGAAADLRGLVQTAAFGYAIGERTLHSGIRQLPAGASAHIDVRTGVITITDHPSHYGPIQPSGDLDEVADAAWSAYQSGLTALTTHPGTSGILMSGGFDTRLVAMGLASAQRPLVALTIGDPGNHEVGVAKRVAELTGASWERRTAKPDLDRLESAAGEMLALAESLCFPTCWFGGMELRDRGAATLSTGYGGETVLGGQGYGTYVGSMGRRGRLLATMQRGVRRHLPVRHPLGAADVAPVVEAMARFHQGELRRLTNRVGEDLVPVVTAEVDLIVEELEAEVRRYLAPGPTAVEQVAERFVFEHHVRKHFGRQELTLDAVLPIMLPTLDSELLLHCATVDPDRKVDHRMYIRMVQRHFGPYARIPTSNVPVRLDLPSPVLWAARTGRALWDDRQVKLQQQTRGEKGRRFGWSNYEVWARESEIFDALPRLIAPWLIKPDWLEKKLATQLSWSERFYSGQDHLVFATISGMVDP